MQGAHTYSGSQIWPGLNLGSRYIEPTGSRIQDCQ